MTTARIHFREITQNVHDIGPPAEQMQSRIRFDLHVGNDVYPDLTCIVKQSAGSSYASHPIEVLLPDAYEGPIEYDAYRRCVEQYYRSQVGSTGGAIRLDAGASAVMRNNRIIAEAECTFEVET